jgi:hypothetical protein
MLAAFFCISCLAASQPILERNAHDLEHELRVNRHREIVVHGRRELAEASLSSGIRILPEYQLSTTSDDALTRIKRAVSSAISAMHNILQVGTMLCDPHEKKPRIMQLAKILR